MKKTLFKLDDFCAHNKIAYVLTGTMALNLLGLPTPKPNDIDILVYDATDEQVDKLKELQHLAGFTVDTHGYEGTCYSFTVNSCKVNAILAKEKTDSITVKLINNDCAKWHLINVQTGLEALKAKKKLCRLKDYQYMQYLIRTILEL